MAKLRHLTVDLPMKGSYVLLIPLPEGQIIRAGSLPEAYFPAGCYAYVGSAMGGFAARLNRHQKEGKKLRWHVDYLLERASIGSIILCETEERAECVLARALSLKFDSIPGFGSSDCRCPSHLFFSADQEQMGQTILATLGSLPIDKRIHRLPPE